MCTQAQGLDHEKFLINVSRVITKIFSSHFEYDSSQMLLTAPFSDAKDPGLSLLHRFT